MGQCETKDRVFYTQALEVMLKIRGSGVRSLQLGSC
jgi:hypothetical protein